MNFKELNLSAPIQRAIAEFGYTTPSPIQQKAIPPVLEGHDLIGCAQTGTGKTAAFALPMLENLRKGPRAKAGVIRALILTPTRELALQIGQNFTDYGKYTGLRHTVIFGGVGQVPQIQALKRGVDVLIACPGRLNDLTNQGFVNLKNLEIFVLDEADRMLDMGFVHDVKRVVAKLPPKRQNLMFSATMPKEIEDLANTFLNSPVKVKVDPVSSTVEKIEQSLYFVEKGNKLALLIHLIKTLSIENALVFSRTKHGADKIVKQLDKAGIAAAAIHGNKGQTARVTALENFKTGQIQILVATDIAARGIDINALSHVFNFDLPEVPETYVHRIGRTARAGAEGIAIAFCASEEKEYLQGIEKLNRKRIPVVAEHPWAGKPSPVKAVSAPVRGRRPATELATKESPVRRETSGKGRNHKVASGIPTPRRKEEKKMANTTDNEKRGQAPKAGQGTRGRQNNAPRQGGANRPNGNRQPRTAGQGGRGNGNNNGGKPRPAGENETRAQAPQGAQAQPKFDPRFLTPQAASSIPHPVSMRQDAAPQIVEARRFNTNNNRSANGEHRDGQQAYRGSANGQGRQQRAPQGQNQRQGQARPSNTSNAPQTGNRPNPRNTSNRGANPVANVGANRGNVQGQPQNAPRNNGANTGANRTVQTPQTATRVMPNQNGQGARGKQGAAQNTNAGHNGQNQNRTAQPTNATGNGARTERGRSDRYAPSASRNERGNAPYNGGARYNSGSGKPSQSGLKMVRSTKPVSGNANDPGLVLITKKPPQQKFTSFDAYMAAHGGETAPIKEQND